MKSKLLNMISEAKKKIEKDIIFSVGDDVTVLDYDNTKKIGKIISIDGNSYEIKLDNFSTDLFYSDRITKIS